MKIPYQIKTYCGVCHDTTPHYLRQDIYDDKRDCYECSKCLHLVLCRGALLRAAEEQNPLTRKRLRELEGK